MRHPRLGGKIILIPSTRNTNNYSCYTRRIHLTLTGVMIGRSSQTLRKIAIEGNDTQRASLRPSNWSGLSNPHITEMRYQPSEGLSLAFMRVTNCASSTTCSTAARQASFAT